MNKFSITYLCHRGLGADCNIYPERHYLESLETEPEDVYFNIKRLDGFYVEGLLCRRWVPVSAVISVDTEHGK